MLDIELEEFDLHYVDYLKFSNSKQYLADDFEACFKYPLHGLLFVPENQVTTVSCQFVSLFYQ